MDCNIKKTKSHSVDYSHKKLTLKLGYLGSKLKECGIHCNKDLFSKEVKIDFKMWGVQLDKQLAKIQIKKRLINRKWEIDLDKLDIKDVIANDTYGIVYKGVYDGQNVAVKVLDSGKGGHPTVAQTHAIRASFSQEFEIWHKLDHPNVMKFIGASMVIVDDTSNTGQISLPARAWCVFEYLEGGMLNKYLINNARTKLSFKIVLQLALNLARGLSFLHSKKIVHRDIKTENMFLDTNGTLKIAYFGMARVEAQSHKDMTGESRHLGYMAPEVLDGKLYNRKCDVYSFGICLWEIYCCDIPYANLSFGNVSSTVIHKNLRPSIPKSCPRSFAHILKKCWNANPEKRPEMEDVVKMLEAIDANKGSGMVSEDQATRCFCFGYCPRP